MALVEHAVTVPVQLLLLVDRPTMTSPSRDIEPPTTAAVTGASSPRM